MKFYTATLFASLFITVFLVSSPVAESACIKFTKNIYFGSTDKNTAGEVSKLQKFLTDEGILKSKITGVFDFETLKAVKAFQLRYGIKDKHFGEFAEASRKSAEEISCGTYKPKKSIAKRPTLKNQPKLKIGTVIINFSKREWLVGETNKFIIGIPEKYRTFSLFLKNNENQEEFFIDEFSRDKKGVYFATLPDISSGKYRVVLKNGQQKLAETKGVIVVVAPEVNDAQDLSQSQEPSDTASLAEENVNEPVITGPSSLKLIEPNGGQYFNTGSEILIRWSSKNYPEDQSVKIYVVKLNPDNTEEEAASLETDNDGLQNMFLPGDEGTYFIRLVCFDAEGPVRGVSASGCRSDDSDGRIGLNYPPEDLQGNENLPVIEQLVVAKFPKGIIEIVYPKGDEKLKPGDTLDIKWSIQNILGLRRLAIVDDLGTESVIINKDFGDPVIVGTHYITKVADFGVGPYRVDVVMEDKNNDIVEVFSNPFNILRNTVNIQEPPVKELKVSSFPTLTKTQSGYSGPISWSSAGIGRVDIYLYNGNKLEKVIVKGYQNFGSYSWAIPNDLVPQTTYTIRVKDADSDLYDESDGGFYVESIASPETSSKIMFLANIFSGFDWFKYILR